MIVYLLILVLDLSTLLIFFVDISFNTYFNLTPGVRRPEVRTPISSGAKRLDNVCLSSEPLLARVLA